MLCNSITFTVIPLRSVQSLVSDDGPFLDLVWPGLVYGLFTTPDDLRICKDGLREFEWGNAEQTYCMIKGQNGYSPCLHLHHNLEVIVFHCPRIVSLICSIYLDSCWLSLGLPQQGPLHGVHGPYSLAAILVLNALGTLNIWPSCSLI